jgi:Flp pilus assembly protein CpaB
MKNTNLNIKNILTNKWTPLVVAIVLALISFFFFNSRINSYVKSNEPVAVVVAKKDLAFNSALSEADLTTITLPNSMVPGTAFLNPADLYKATLSHNISKGEIITQNDAQATPSGILGTKIKSQRKGILLPSSWFSGPFSPLRVGDTISIFIYFPDDSSVKTLVQDIKVVEVFTDSQKNVDKILVEMDLDNISVLFTFHSANFPMLLVLDGQSLDDLPKAEVKQ